MCLWHSLQCLPYHTPLIALARSHDVTTPSNPAHLIQWRTVKEIHTAAFLIAFYPKHSTVSLRSAITLTNQLNHQEHFGLQYLVQRQPEIKPPTI